VLFNEPKLLKAVSDSTRIGTYVVSVLFNEPKLLKSASNSRNFARSRCFSALQRAEIAETKIKATKALFWYVSVLFNEPKLLKPASSRSAPLRDAFQCSSTSRNC